MIRKFFGDILFTSICTLIIVLWKLLIKFLVRQWYFVPGIWRKVFIVTWFINANWTVRKEMRYILMYLVQVAYWEIQRQKHNLMKMLWNSFWSMEDILKGTIVMPNNSCNGFSIMCWTLRGSQKVNNDFSHVLRATIWNQTFLENSFNKDKSVKVLVRLSAGHKVQSLFREWF